ncbi:hypothetical protein ABKV19_026811 [Rosa sericea]
MRTARIQDIPPLENDLQIKVQENPGLDSILVPSQQVPFQKKKKLSVCEFEVAFKVLHEKQIKRKCVLRSSIVDFSPVLLLYSKATHNHQIRLLRIETLVIPDG